MNGNTKKFCQYALAALIVCFALGQTPAVADGDEPEDITPATLALRTSANGHYYADGQINGHNVSFLVDTGASAVVIPEAMANELGLVKTRTIQMVSASEIYDAYETIIPELSVGPIKLYNVLGNINPRAKNQQILLGMTALKNIDLLKENGQVVLRGTGESMDPNQSPVIDDGSTPLKIHLRDCMGNSKVIDRNTLECMKGLKPSNESKSREALQLSSLANPGQLLSAQ